MALSSSALGIRTVGRLEIFDIVFHLATIDTAQTDGPSHFTTVYKRHVIENFDFRRGCNSTCNAWPEYQSASELGYSSSSKFSSIAACCSSAYA